MDFYFDLNLIDKYYHHLFEFHLKFIGIFFKKQTTTIFITKNKATTITITITKFITKRKAKKNNNNICLIMEL